MKEPAMPLQDMQFQQELATYESNRDKLVAESAGKYVVIHGSEVAGAWSTYEDALKEGYKRYHLEPFLVKRVEGVETILCFTRDLPLCQSSAAR